MPNCSTSARASPKASVGGVALRRDCQEHHRVRQRELALGTAETIERGPGIERDLRAARIGEPDVLVRHAYDAAREVVRVAPAVDHAREPVQRAVRIGAAHRLVERGDLVVELFAALVEAPAAAGRDFAHVVERDRRDVAVRFREIGGDLEHAERAPRVAIAGVRERDQRVVRDLDAPRAETALGIVEGTPQ